MVGAGRASAKKHLIWTVSPAMTVMGSSLGISEICGKAVPVDVMKRKEKDLEF